MHFIIIAVLCCCCSGVFAFRDPYSPGETVPDRVEIAAGNDLVIYCTMNPLLFPHRNASHLDFYVGDQAVSRDLITAVNATTIVMRMRSVAAQETRYRCQCGESAIMESQVFVGTRPQPVQDFACRSYDCSYMVCNFTKPYNPVVVRYNLTFYTTSPAYKNTMHCEFTEGGGVCNTTATLRPCMEQYHFVLQGSNELGLEQQEFTVNNCDVMVLAAPGKDVQVLPGYPSTDAITLAWHMQRSESCRPNNLQWEILLQPDGFPEMDLSSQPLISRKSRKDWSLQLRHLPYAFYWYTLRLRVKVRSAANTEEMWSDPLVYRFRTAARAPARPPLTAAGSYYIDSSETRVRLYWEELQPHEYAGENFTYAVSEVRCNDQPIDQRPLQMEMNSALFELQRNANCEFLIRSQNSHGVSPTASRIVVYAHSTSKNRKPLSIHNLYHDGNRTYTLSWKPPVYTERSPNYTVYWCHSKRALQNGCNGSIHFAQLGPNVYRFTTAPQDHTLNLAVSADYEQSNTGMHWTACTLDVNSDLVKIEPDARAISSSALQIEWSPESVCPSILDGYNLTYCEVAPADSGSATTTPSGGEPTHAEGGECVSAPVTLKIDRNSKKYIVEQLKPFTTYRLEMFMYSSKKVGKVSDSLLRRTLEAAPSPPRLLNVSRVTNTSATFSWLLPSQPNGLIRDYVLTLNSQRYWIETPRQYTDANERIEYVVSNLTSYTTYTAQVVAHTVEYSEPSKDIHFTTMIGYPSMPSNTWVRNSINDTTIQWHRPATPSGRVEFYEVAVTQTRHQRVIKKRISFVAGETMCLVKSQQCSDPEVRTKFEVRAVNAALLTHEVDDAFVAGEGFATQLDEWPAADNSYWDADELACLGERHGPHEVDHLVAPYRNRSQYQLFHSPWQFAYENSCPAPGLSKNIEVALIVVVAAVMLIGPFYLASKKYTKMANINCKLPSDLDVYVTKDGPPRDLYEHDLMVAPTHTSSPIATATSVPPSRPSCGGSEFIGHNEKLHLLPQCSTSSDANDSSSYMRADSRFFKRDDSIDCSLDCGSSVRTAQTTLDSGNETGGNFGRRYLRSQSESSARSVLSDEPEEDEEEPESSLEMDQMLLVQPSSAYVDSSTFAPKADIKANGYVNPTSFGSWPQQHAGTSVMPASNGYVRATDLAPPPAMPAHSSPYVQASDLHDLHFNMAAARQAPPLQQTAPSSGYMTLEDLHKFTVVPPAPTIANAETALLATPTAPRNVASNYVTPSNFATTKTVGRPLGGYVTPRDLNVLAATDQQQY